MYGKYIKHPVAINALSTILLRAWPKMGGKRAVQNAVAILEELHRHGLQIGPAEGFGENSPREQEVTPTRGRRTPDASRPRRIQGRGDPFENFMEELAKMEERRPWEIK